MTDQTQDKQHPNAMITAWQEQVAPLAGFAETASHILGAIENPLGELYTQAEQAGDTATIERVMAVWNQSQQLANLIPPFAAALQGGAATIEELKHQRDVIAEELKDLVEDIQNADTMNPLVEQLADFLEEGIWDCAEASGELTTRDEVYDQLYSEIVVAFKVSFPAAVSLISALRGDPEELDEYRRELIQHLLKSFEAESHDRDR